MKERPTDEQLRADYERSLRWMPERKYEDFVAQRVAPEGKLWVCLACGKTAVDREEGGGGWDESCYLNSDLFNIERLVYGGSRVVHVKEAA